MKLFLLLFFVVFITGSSIVNATQEVFKITKLEYNKEIWGKFELKISKYNATHQAMNANFTLLKDLGMNILANTAVYTVDDGEKSLMTEIKNSKICDFLKSEDPEVQKKIKESKASCPLKKGSVTISNQPFNIQKIPPANYLIIVNVSEDNVKLFSLEIEINLA